MTETVNLQRKELLKVKNEHSKILKKIDFEKNTISNSLEMQKKQPVQAQAEQVKIESRVNAEKEENQRD